MKSAGAEDGTAVADSRHRANSGSLRLPKNPGAAESGRLEGGKVAGVSSLSGRRLGPAEQAEPSVAAAMHRRECFRPTAPNQVWSLDFVADQLADGRRFRALTVLDIFTRESLAIEVGQRLKGEDVVGALNQIRQKRGTPKLLFCDNGSEFTSQMMDLWAYHNQVQIDFSRPGKPTDNAYVESFNRTLRAECWTCTGSQR